MAKPRESISVQLDADAARRVKKAARLSKQSESAFVQQAVEERARRVLLEWAVARHKQGTATFSELADETGLAIEEIMAAMEQDPEVASQQFLELCEAAAKAQDTPEFLRLA